MTGRPRASDHPAPLFVQQLRDARLAAGLSQNTLTDRLGWGSVDRLRAYEAGNRAIHPRFAAKWADALGLTITTEPNEAHCRICHCTEDNPCEGGCAWVTDGTLEIDLCTVCAWTIARDAHATGLYWPKGAPKTVWIVSDDNAGRIAAHATPRGAQNAAIEKWVSDNPDRGRETVFQWYEDGAADGEGTCLELFAEGRPTGIYAAPLHVLPDQDDPAAAIEQIKGAGRTLRAITEAAHSNGIALSQPATSESESAP